MRRGFDPATPCRGTFLAPHHHGATVRSRRPAAGEEVSGEEAAVELVETIVERGFVEFARRPRGGAGESSVRRTSAANRVEHGLSAASFRRARLPC
jgi:hypothetical protein